MIISNISFWHKKNFFYLLLVSSLTILFSACSDSKADLTWPEISIETKPWTRWWWHGSAVTKEGITTEMEAYHAAGIGGLELTPIYGVIGDEEENIPFLSEQWVDMLIHTLQEAERLGMGIDMATGTGWPFGGPWVSDKEASKYLAHKVYSLREGRTLAEKLIFKQDPILRAVRNPLVQLYHNSGEDVEEMKSKLKDPNFVFQYVPPKIEQILQPIHTNENLQELALDQVRFAEEILPFVVVAHSDKGDKLNITGNLDSLGNLDWEASEGKWTIYALFEGSHGKMVERAAPGGEGNVIDHFSQQAIQTYLKRFDDAFEGKNIGRLRAFFNDSYEVDDAFGQANWTPEFLDTFKLKKGYDLINFLPALFDPDSTDTHPRILSDVREVFSDLLLETFTAEWKKWAHNQGKIIRNQAHGSPANILDLYALSDIPETEGNDFIRAKFAASAGNVTGKTLISSETATWLNEHFQTSYTDLKKTIDLFQMAGVNHIFYHGTAYSPPDEPWPGRLFYASIHANPRNPLWNDMAAFNQYVTRVQSITQAGVPDNDVLLYFPIYDRFATPGNEMLTHFDAHGADLDSMPFSAAAEDMHSRGYSFDFISDRQILQLQMAGKKILSGRSTYVTLVVPETKYMPLKTFKKIWELAYNGATIVFSNSLPASVPGMANLENRLREFNSLKTSLKYDPDGVAIQEFKLGKGKIVIGKNLNDLLIKAKIEREKMVDQGLDYTRRVIGDNEFYFIANWSDKAIDGWITLSKIGQAVGIMNPNSGKTGLARIKYQGDNTQVYLQIPVGGSVLLKLFNNLRDGEEWPYYRKLPVANLYQNGWEMTFLEGGPAIPSSQKDVPIQLWTDLGPIYQSFSGRTRYRHAFSDQDEQGIGYLLELGEVHESARVHINDHYIGTLYGPEYRIFIDQSFILEDNLLDIYVSNTMTNRIIYLEKENEFWKKFYNINISARFRENLGEFGIFDAADWPYRPSGMKGPVTMTKVVNLE